MSSEERLDEGLREHRRVHLEAGAERRRRADPRSDAAEARALNRLMQLQRVAPEMLVAERVEPECLPATIELIEREGADRVVEGRRVVRMDTTVAAAEASLCRHECRCPHG